LLIQKCQDLRGFKAFFSAIFEFVDFPGEADYSNIRKMPINAPFKIPCPFRNCKNPAQIGLTIMNPNFFEVAFLMDIWAK
jgi:hypothetical protein